MKTIIFLAFVIFCLTNVKSSTKMTTKDVEELLEGVLLGIVEDVPDIGPCIEDSGFDVDALIKAIEDMRAGGPGNIALGLKEIYSALQMLPEIYKNCSGVPEEVEQLEAIFSSPYTFIFHTLQDIIVNGVNIADSIEALFQDFDNQQYKSAGFQIGDMLEEIFIGGQTTNQIKASEKFSRTDIEQLLIGVLEGIIEDIPDIGPCIKDGVYEIEHVVDAIKLLHDGGPINTENGVKELYYGLARLPEMVKSCHGIPGEVRKLEEIFSSPYTFLFHSAIDIIVNGFNIYHNLEKMKYNFDHHYYKKAGYEIGDMLEEIFIGNGLQKQ